jgi:hypothetical protein
MDTLTGNTAEEEKKAKALRLRKTAAIIMLGKTLHEIDAASPHDLALIQSLHAKKDRWYDEARECDNEYGGHIELTEDDLKEITGNG